MKLKSEIKKRLLLYFMLFPLPIYVVVGIDGIYGIGTTWEAVLFCTLLAGWLTTCYIIICRISDDFEQHRKNLTELEKGAISGYTAKPSSLFASSNDILDNISHRIKKQEDELQREKIRRLRSVIDGQDQERNRLSRELHDGLGQSLIAIKLQLENAETQNYSMMRAGIDSAKDMIDLTIEEVRRVCNALLPAALNEFGIVSTLRARCDEMATLANFKVVFETEGSLDRIDKKSKIYLYRIAQEALNNIAKHARASEVVVSLRRSDNIVTLLVKDNGKGFIFDPVSFAQRNGLQNMQERTSLLHGVFTLDSKPGNGTTIKVTIPYNSGDGKD